MARVTEFFHDQATSSRPHPTNVEAGWKVLSDRNGKRLLQLSTYGSDDPKSEKKVSQTLQFDEAAAKHLIDLIAAAFKL